MNTRDWSIRNQLDLARSRKLIHAWSYTPGEKTPWEVSFDGQHHQALFATREIEFFLWGLALGVNGTVNAMREETN